MRGRGFFHHQPADVSISQIDEHVDFDLDTGRLERLHLDRSIITHAVDAAIAAVKKAATRVTPQKSRVERVETQLAVAAKGSVIVAGMRKTNFKCLERRADGPIVAFLE